MTGLHRGTLDIVDMHPVRSARASERVADRADLAASAAADGSVAADVRSATPKPARPLATAFAAEPDATGFVVVPVRDAQLVVRALSLQPAVAVTPDALLEPLAHGASPAVLSCVALMLWMALRRGR